MKKYIYLLLGAAALWSSCTQDNYLDTLSGTKTTTMPEVLTKGSLPGKLHVKVQSDVLSDIKLVNPGGVTLQSAPSKLSATLNSVRATALYPLFNMDPRFEKRMACSGWCSAIYRLKEGADLSSPPLTSTGMISVPFCSTKSISWALSEK